MIKISYIEPTHTETPDSIARSNIMISDRFKKADYLEMSCISWLKNNSERNYQDLEKLLRNLNIDSHVIAYPIKIIPEGVELGMPNINKNDNLNINPYNFEYTVKISCKYKKDAINELLSFHPSYEHNFECLKKTGCLMTKNSNSELNLNISKEHEDIKKVLDCKLKLNFEYYKPIESIHYLIDDLKIKYGLEPEKKACGEINGNKVYGLTLNDDIASPIGWIEKKICMNDSEENIEYELIDFRNLKIEKNQNTD